MVKLVIMDCVSERPVHTEDPAWCRMHSELFNVNLRQVLHLPDPWKFEREDDLSFEHFPVGLCLFDVHGCTGLCM